MDLNSANLRFILGLKLRSLRSERGLSLQQAADSAGLAVSYLSEIEKGKKYPKPEKLLALARALDVPFDQLVSLHVSDELESVKEAASSEFFREFPFQLFGVEPNDVVELLASEPERAGALARTFLEVGRTYDVHVDQLLLAALRSYQELNANYFEEFETAAAAFRASQGWDSDANVTSEMLAEVLEREWGYVIDSATLKKHDVLGGLRSVFLEGPPPELLINGRLSAAQQAFLLAREIGYRTLKLVARARTSVWLRVESFDQVLNNFKASYFAGALLMDRDRLVADLKALFSAEKWSSAAWTDLMGRYNATPEMLLHRLTELLPRQFGLDEIYFMRFTCSDDARFKLTKVFNMSSVPVPHGVGLNETYCRRWPAIRMLQKIASRKRRSVSAPIVEAQRLHFLDEDADFFVVTTARPLALSDHGNSSVSLGFRMNDAFRAAVRFWDDPKVERVVVNLTCERCPLGESECRERAAPPLIHDQDAEQVLRERAVAELAESRGR